MENSPKRKKSREKPKSVSPATGSESKDIVLEESDLAKVSGGTYERMDWK